MKVAIIGCGYVGSEVARLWKTAGDEVTVTTTTPEKQKQLQAMRQSHGYAIASEVVVLTGNDLAQLKDDIVRAIAFAREKQLQGIYNLNSDQVLTSKEFFDNLFQAHNLPSITWDISQPSTRSFNLKLSNQKLKNAGFEFQHPQIEFI